MGILNNFFLKSSITNKSLSSKNGRCRRLDDFNSWSRAPLRKKNLLSIIVYMTWWELNGRLHLVQQQTPQNWSFQIDCHYLNRIYLFDYCERANIDYFPANLLVSGINRNIDGSTLVICGLNKNACFIAAVEDELLCTTCRHVKIIQVKQTLSLTIHNEYVLIWRRSWPRTVRSK